MRKRKLFAPLWRASFTFVAFWGAVTVFAQTAKVEGITKARNGETIILQLSDSREVTVLLTDTTDVSQKQGLLQVRRKEMAMAALIPGLSIDVEGNKNAIRS
jgi:hypothetical protein